MNDRNERLDALEAELQALAPAEPSAGLHERVGRALSADETPTWGVPARAPRRWYLGGLAAAAACVVAAAAVWRVGRPDPRAPVPVVTTHPAPAPHARFDEDRPALAAYRRALGRSPAALDEMFDRHAARPLGSDRGSPAASARVTASSEFNLLR